MWKEIENVDFQVEKDFCIQSMQHWYFLPLPAHSSWICKFKLAENQKGPHNNTYKKAKTTIKNSGITETKRCHFKDFIEKIAWHLDFKSCYAIYIKV